VASAEGSTVMLWTRADDQAVLDRGRADGGPSRKGFRDGRVHTVRATFKDGAAAAEMTRGLVIWLRGTLKEANLGGGGTNTFVLVDCEINPRK
jgi:hypothetical protein